MNHYHPGARRKAGVSFQARISIGTDIVWPVRYSGLKFHISHVPKTDKQPVLSLITPTCESLEYFCVTRNCWFLSSSFIAVVDCDDNTYKTPHELTLSYTFPPQNFEDINNNYLLVTQWSGNYWKKEKVMLGFTFRPGLCINICYPTPRQSHIQLWFLKTHIEIPSVND